MSAEIPRLPPAGWVRLLVEFEPGPGPVQGRISDVSAGTSQTDTAFRGWLELSSLIGSLLETEADESAG